MSASEASGSRLVGAALRCYPARWRRRHAEEAAELAALLIRDGCPAVSIALSYLIGAIREWLIPRPGQPLSKAAAALLAATCLIGFSAGLVAQTVPARAAPSGPASPRVKPALPGSPLQVTPCPVPRWQATPAPTAIHSQPSIQGTANARSC